MIVLNAKKCQYNAPSPLCRLFSGVKW